MAVPSVSLAVSNANNAENIPLHTYSHCFVHPSCHSRNHTITHPHGLPPSSLSFPVPSGPPQGLAVARRTSTSISLTWRDPAPDKINDRGGVTGFVVRRNRQRVATVTGRTYTFTGLSVATSYKFEVLAINEQGTAPDNHAAQLTASTASGGTSYIPIHLYIANLNTCCLSFCLCMSLHVTISCSAQPPSPEGGPPQVLQHLPSVEGPRALCR